MSRSQSWRSDTDSHSISSISSLPPAYCDATTGRTRSPQPVRLAHSLPAQPATGGLNICSTADKAPWLSGLPQRPRYEGSSTPSTSTILDSDALSYISSVPTSHSRDSSLPTGKPMFGSHGCGSSIIDLIHDCSQTFYGLSPISQNAFH
jgi:hypothetical protein